MSANSPIPIPSYITYTYEGFLISLIKGSTSRRFSAGMAIVNMLLRPITAFFLYKLLGERNALYGGSSYQESPLGPVFTDNRRRYHEGGPPAQELVAAASAAEISSLQKV